MSLKSPFVFAMSVAVAAAFAQPATAAAPQVDARLTVALIQYDGRAEVTAAASAAKPGDVLEYSARYSNRGSASVDALAPTMPIPAGTEYLPTDTSPRPTHASLDGVNFASIPMRRAVKGDDGITRVVDVPAREYRALRWTVGSLAAGSEVTVRARVRVNQFTSLARR